MKSCSGRYSLPRIRRLVLRHFTLYSRRDEIKLDLKDGVFCLAGANGLGKSTFLLAINYGITGIVPDPNRAFESAEDYYRKNMDFSEEFFDGRISESDRKRAEIELEFTAGERIFVIRRGMFDPVTLRAFDLFDKASREPIEIPGKARLSGPKLYERYQEELVAQSGLASFEQLVFLQHLVLTFDERRHLLLWNRRELEQTLFLAFGVDSQTAKYADELRKKIARAESHGRNAKWQATKVRKQIEELERARQETEDLSDRQEEVLEEHQKLDDVSRAIGLTNGAGPKQFPAPEGRRGATTNPRRFFRKDATRPAADAPSPCAADQTAPPL